MDTLPTGEIDYEHFRREVVRNAARPAIVNVNVGTTVKGAVDDLDRILSILQEAGYSEDRFYIHCDGALFGLMVWRLPVLYSLTRFHGMRLFLAASCFEWTMGGPWRRCHGCAC